MFFSPQAALFGESGEAEELLAKLQGRIILRADEQGQAYYISPKDKEMHFLGRPEEALQVMREHGIGITDKELTRIQPAVMRLSGTDSDGDGLPNKFEQAIGTDSHDSDTSGNGFSDYQEVKNGYNPRREQGRLPVDKGFSKRQRGKILLQVEGKGEAWYVNPEDGLRYFLGHPADAFQVMSELATGVSDDIFDKLQGKEVDLTKRIEVDLEDQELSYFWGGIRIETYPVSTGKPATPTPPGNYTISNKAERAWSPFGLWMPYWMGLDSGRIGIHQLPYWPNGYREGENHLGVPVSHGCIRLGIAPAQEVYEWAETGVPVYIY